MSEAPVLAYLAYIPSPVLHHDTLSANAKLFYAEITALSNRFGYCFASNAYLAEQFKMSERTVSRLISELEALHFITVKIVKNGQTGAVLGRRIYPDIVSPELIPEGDFVIIDHTTKLSAPVDKIVDTPLTNLSTGYFINNKINNIYTGAQEEEPKTERKAPDEAARAFLAEWVKETFPENGEQLLDCFFAFCDMRKAKGAPMRTEGAAKRCVKRLMGMAEKNPAVMCEILDQSIRNGWTDVYPLRGSATGTGGTQTVRKVADEEWL